jgi:hypothetical protein
LIRLRLEGVDWPAVCACCGAPAETKVASRRRFLRKSRHQVPVCTACAAHVAHYVATFPVIGYLAHKRRKAARALCGPACTSAGPPVVELAIGLGFTSDSYAERVARENEAKLLGAPEIVRAQLEPAKAIVVRERKPDA